MNIDNQYKRAVLYFLFLCGETARSEAIKINSVHDEHTISVRTIQKWYKKFKDGGTIIDDEPRSGRPVNYSNDIPKSLLKSEPQLTVNQIAERMDSFHRTMFRHLKEFRKVSKVGKWVSHELSEVNWQQRMKSAFPL